MALQLRTKSFILHEMLTFQESMEIDFLNKTQKYFIFGFSLFVLKHVVQGLKSEFCKDLG